MNRLYFFCEDCKEFVDAGERHGLSSLRERHLVPDEFPVELSVVSITAEAVMSCTTYWTLDAGMPSDRRKSLLATRSFLETHKRHQFAVGDIHRLTRNDEWLDWLIDEDGTDLLPRFLVERLGLTEWSRVVEHVGAMRFPPWWWGDSDSDRTREQARKKFEEL